MASEKQMAKDPVCGMEVDKGKAITGSKAGEKYYFCSESCKEEFLGKKKEITAGPNIGDKQEKVIIPVRGMHCASCVAKIEKALKKVEGVADADVNFGTEKASVSYNAEKTSPKKLADAIRKAGYEPVFGHENQETGQVTFKVVGMHSDHCVGVVTKAVKSLNGIKKVEASFANARADIGYDPGQVSKEEIKKAIDEAGYEAIEQTTEEETREDRKSTRLNSSHMSISYA